MGQKAQDRQMGFDECVSNECLECTLLRRNVKKTKARDLGLDSEMQYVGVLSTEPSQGRSRTAAGSELHPARDSEKS
ncbi:hypothetical protein RRG08_025976 [Elysia crispata]|uniref:Uncharacterized protein n=1 Tax=Elysia crispata TaxID=231223 RepID=A0AAE1DGK9_9GAST|nr:hypothetical protein RRG08_025976 [Elysia crispata]